MILSLACDTILILSQEALFCYPHHFRLLYSPQHSWGIRLFIHKEKKTNLHFKGNDFVLFGIQLNRKLRNAVDFDNIDIQIPGNNPYKKYGTIPLVPKTDVNLCTECKACAKACPAGAISMENSKKTDKEKCISCMKCVYSCRKKARYVSNMKLNMAQKKLTKVCKNDKLAEIFI